MNIPPDIRIRMLEDHCDAQTEMLNRYEDWLRFLNRFIPAWADPDIESPRGLCPTMYGTLTWEEDAKVRAKVAMIRRCVPVQDDCGEGDPYCAEHS